jgi:hypothetical protein
VALRMSNKQGKTLFWGMYLGVYWLFVSGLGGWAAAPERGVFSGQVVCLGETMAREHRAELPPGHEPLWGLKADDGRYFTLLRNRFSEALFVEPSLRGIDLRLTGRVFPGSNLLEVELIRTLREGKAYQVTYYCEVCEIFSVAPGICECCQAPTELRERER